MIKNVYYSYYLCVVLLLCSVKFISGCNLSPKFIQIHETQNQSYFGYTVHLRSNPASISSSVIIGAPKANSTYKTEINEPGSIYQCAELFEGNPNCKEFLLNNREIKETSNFKFDEYRNQSFLGASIDGQNTKDGRFVACAPRWSNTLYGNPDNLLLNNGICYWSSNSVDDNSTITALIPLLDRDKQQITKKDSTYYIYQYGQFGFSTHLTKDSKILFGCPGLNMWTGGVVQYVDWHKPIIDHNRQRRSIAQETKNYVPLGQATLSKINLPESIYFGYAVSSGIFRNEKEIMYVASAPRYNDKGAVFIFNFEKSNDENKSFNKKSIEIYKTFMGELIGAYFGASICVIDVNGDNFDDVIIGAPKYSFDRDDIDSGDEGAVYVFINNQKNDFHDFYTLNFNKLCSSEFGTSISSIGDLDKDGFNDVVVGAPYENDGRGAIYIYLGGENGLNSQASQYFRAKDLNQNLRGFGFSISRGVDIDNNHYSDLAVGAYLSGDVVLFRSHPVAYLSGNITTSVPKLNVDAKHFNIKVCIKYAGQYVPNNIDALMDISTNGPSLFSNETMRNLNKILKIPINNERCDLINVYFRDRIQDFSMPVRITMKLNIPDNKMDSFCPTCPILHSTSKENVTISIPFSNGCANNTCYPELTLKTSYPSSFILGSKSYLSLNIFIHNTGEPAYKVNLQIITNVIKGLKFVLKPEECSDTILPTDLDNSINCIYNSVKNDKNILLEIDANSIPIDYQYLEFSINVNSTGVESNLNDNKIQFKLPLLIQGEFNIMGTSSRDETAFKDEDGILIKHLDPIDYTYTVQNIGPSPLQKSEILFEIPFKYHNKELFDIKELKATLQNRVITCTRLNNSFPKNKFIKRDYEYPLNETLFFNCSGSADGITCASIVCQFGLMEKNKQKVDIRFSLQPIAENIDMILSDFGKDYLEMDIVTVVEPLVTVNSISGGKVFYNMGTTFMARPSNSISIWWIILAVIVGLLVLGAITAGLMKYGFFHRSHQELMQAKLVKEGSTELVIQDTDL